MEEELSQMMERFVEAMRHSDIEYIVMEPHQSFSGSVIVIDADENLHECWEGHSLVNVCVPMRIEDAVRYFKDPSLFSLKNAKLRERVSELEELTDHRHYIPQEWYVALQTENAKLRELVDAWMGCGTRYHTMQGACPMFDENEENFCKAAKLASELGIEEDE